MWDPEKSAYCLPLLLPWGRIGIFEPITVADEKSNESVHEFSAYHSFPEQAETFVLDQLCIMQILILAAVAAAVHDKS